MTRYPLPLPIVSGVCVCVGGGGAGGRGEGLGGLIRHLKVEPGSHSRARADWYTGYGVIVAVGKRRFDLLVLWYICHCQPCK